MLTRAKAVAAVFLVSFLSLGGCAANSGAQGGPVIGATDEARVQVSNHNWADMTVYVIRNGMRQRLGTVTSMASRVFRIPPTLVNASGDLRLLADPVGSTHTYTSSSVHVWPGQTVDFKIENHLAISSVSVFE